MILLFLSTSAVDNRHALWRRPCLSVPGSVLSSFNGFVNVNKGQFLALKDQDVFYILEVFLDKLYVFSFLVESSLPVTS